MKNLHLLSLILLYVLTKLTLGCLNLFVCVALNLDLVIQDLSRRLQALVLHNEVTRVGSIFQCEGNRCPTNGILNLLHVLILLHFTNGFSQRIRLTQIKLHTFSSLITPTLVLKLPVSEIRVLLADYLEVVNRVLTLSCRFTRLYAVRAVRRDRIRLFFRSNCLTFILRLVL